MTYKKLLEELKLKRDAEPVKVYVILNNKIVSKSKSYASGMAGAHISHF